MGWLEPILLKILGPVASWIHKRQEQRVTPALRLVIDARREGRMILREIKLARDETASQALCRRIIKWYGDFELALAEIAPDVLEEFRQQGIPSGYVAESGEVVQTPITLAVLRDTVVDDLKALRTIKVLLTGSVSRVKLLRLQRALRRSWRERVRARDGRGS